MNRRHIVLVCICLIILSILVLGSPIYPIVEWRTCGKMPVEILIDDPESVIEAKYENFFSYEQAAEVQKVININNEHFLTLRPLICFDDSCKAEIGVTHVEYLLPFFNMTLYQRGLLVALKRRDGLIHTYIYQYDQMAKGIERHWVPVSRIGHDDC